MFQGELGLVKWLRPHRCTTPVTAPSLLRRTTRRFDVVVHFAGRKAVGESVTAPMLYYTHNLLGSVNLVEAMRKHGCKNVRCWHALLRTSPALCPQHRQW